MFATVLKVALFLLASPYRRPVSLRPSTVAAEADAPIALPAKPAPRSIRVRAAA